jgi:hypothetical protein
VWSSVGALTPDSHFHRVAIVFEPLKPASAADQKQPKSGSLAAKDGGDAQPDPSQRPRSTFAVYVDGRLVCRGLVPPFPSPDDSVQYIPDTRLPTEPAQADQKYTAPTASTAAAAEEKKRLSITAASSPAPSLRRQKSVATGAVHGAALSAPGLHRLKSLRLESEHRLEHEFKLSKADDTKVHAAAARRDSVKPKRKQSVKEKEEEEEEEEAKVKIADEEEVVDEEEQGDGADSETLDYSDASRYGSHPFALPFMDMFVCTLQLPEEVYDEAVVRERATKVSVFPMQTPLTAAVRVRSELRFEKCVGY